MDERYYFIVTGLIFLISGSLHLIRSVFQWPFFMGPLFVPLWVSYLLVLLAVVLIIWSVKLLRK